MMVGMVPDEPPAGGKVARILGDIGSGTRGRRSGWGIQVWSEAVE